MSRWIAPVVLVGILGTASAAPREKGPSADALAAGERFARQLGVIVQSISREYVRPVATSDLYCAAVQAIYDEARRPRPTNLLRDLKAAKDEHVQFDLVKRARAAVHGAPELEDGRDLLVGVRSLTTVLDPHSILIPSGVLNGTTTSNTYGFEFEGEAQALPRRNRAQTEGKELLLPAGDPGPAGVPPTPFRVLHVKPGTPAQRAGLRPGDMIRAINGITVDSASASKALASLYGQGPSKRDPGVHHLEIDRAGVTELLKLTLERASFQPESLFGVTRNRDNSWDYWLDRDAKIAYVRLGAIENDSGDRLQEILHELRDPKGLIFDLRWCPGGYIDAATQIASTFLDSGIVARMKYRNPERGSNTEIHADGGLVQYKAGDYPVLLLVNGETVGGGELIAAALRDNGRAVLAGSRTFGKATIQWPLALSGLPGYSFKLTGGTYTRPNGKSLQRFPESKPEDDWGLRPDPGYDIPMSAELARKLKDSYLLYALRPGGSREALDLDDPLADPQRVRALRLIKKLLEERAKKEQ
jgi:carboxyl-terminal processing protease